VPEPVKIAAYAPWVLAGVGAIEMAFERARRVPLKLKELAQISAAMQIGCPF